MTTKAEERKQETPKTDNILEVKNLKTYFTNESGIVKAVDNVSFHVRKGETVGIVGESGSGKSVTSLSVMRLIQEPPGKIVDGQILFNSRGLGKVDLARLPERNMRTIRGNEISMIFQEPMTSLNPVLTCGHQVMEAILLHQPDLCKQSKTNLLFEKAYTRLFNFVRPLFKWATLNRVKVFKEKLLTKKEKEAKKRTVELFKKVKLPRPNKIFRSYPHEISGGQKQRVMIAMAMSCNPSILIADEPTTALDVTVQATTLDLMRQLRDETDMSIMFITHDLGVIAEIADYVLVMYRGKIVEQGSVLDIFSDPQHPYTKGLLACRPRMDIKLKVLPTVDDFMGVDEEGKLVEKKRNAFSSVGQALLFNFTSDEEIKELHAEMKAKEPHLIVNDLKKYFPLTKNIMGKPKTFVKAVDGVSFEVYPGETVGLVGESGCGKSTLGRTILRLIEPTSGQVLLRDQESGELIDVATYKTREMRKLRKDVQIIFQDPYSSLNPRMTIGESIIEPMRVNGIEESDFARTKEAIRLLEKVSLNKSHFDRYPHEFSGGQRQRICIARALALKPKFIICDESVSALDVSVQAQVLNLLNDLKAEFNFTYIFISHDLSVVKFMADRIIVMNEGKIEEIGDSQDIYENPTSEYTKKLIKAIPVGDLDKIKQIQSERNILT